MAYPEHLNSDWFTWEVEMARRRSVRLHPQVGFQAASVCKLTGGAHDDGD